MQVLNLVALSHRQIENSCIVQRVCFFEESLNLAFVKVNFTRSCGSYRLKYE